MAEVSDKLLKNGFALESVNKFRKRFGITCGAVAYAMRTGSIDYVELDERTKAVVLTERTLQYSPNKNKNRE